MRILMLGGTSFIGRTIVETALLRGDEVTIFSRGKTGAALFPKVPRLIGDRETGDYAAVADGEWDAVVDVSAILPRQVEQAMDALSGRVGRYLFISSHAVYSPEGTVPDSDESAARKPPLARADEIDNETYGRLKVGCEDAVLNRFGAGATIVRPGRVAGPYDNQDVFTYWVRRAARGGKVALPADPRQPVQVVDSRDLARLVVRLLADDRPGAFNAVGPAEPVTFAGLIETCAAAAGSRVEIVPVPTETAAPMFPLVRADWDSQRRSAARARAAGMPATPLSKTAADVLAWDRGRGEPPLSRGFSAAEEEEVLGTA